MLPAGVFLGAQCGSRAEASQPDFLELWSVRP